ncbi:MAG TPA: hypothetical protein VNT22_02365, partial [Baekduia sp.]|nr:hypothetical protein [Baekduia sp.]
DDDTTKAPAPATAVATAADFPAAAGKNLEQLVAKYAPGPVLAPSVSAIEPGRTNRIAFAAFDIEHRQVRGAQIAVYLLDGKLRNAKGPFVAKPVSLDVDAQYRSRQTASDLNANDAIYVAEIPVPKAGKYAIAGIAKLQGKTLATSQFAIVAGKRGGPPDIGDPAPAVDTPTVTDASGDLSKIDTRVPPLPELHRQSAADVIGKKPLVLLFATPQLCSSRVCGPVNDTTFQVSAQPQNKGVVFIHQEIYNDNEIDHGFRPQVRRYALPTEPWAFIIDRRGIIRDRLEGPFGAAELQAAVDKIR